MTWADFLVLVIGVIGITWTVAIDSLVLELLFFLVL